MTSTTILQFQSKCSTDVRVECPPPRYWQHLRTKQNLMHCHHTLNLKHFMSLPALHRPCRSNRGPLLSSPRLPHPPLPPPFLLQKEKNNQVTRTATGLSTKRSQRFGANPGIRLGIFLVVIGVEAVPLEETPPLPRRLRSRCALRSRGGSYRETASGEA
jgi:hypothetical protein